MKTSLIVGATSGIGEGLARLYAERGEVKIGVMGVVENRRISPFATVPMSKIKGVPKN